MPFSRLEIGRLVLRRFVDTDLDARFAYRSDPEVARYRQWQPRDRETAWDRLAGVCAGEPATRGPGFGSRSMSRTSWSATSARAPIRIRGRASIARDPFAHPRGCTKPASGSGAGR
jgi:hypothetical protein